MKNQNTAKSSWSCWPSSLSERGMHFLKAVGVVPNIWYWITINLEKQTISKLRISDCSGLSSLWVFPFLAFWLVFRCLSYCQVGVMVFITNTFHPQMLMGMLPAINFQMSNWHKHKYRMISPKILWKICLGDFNSLRSTWTHF